MAITTACYEVVKELVSPFYNAASLPTASLITLKNRAEALYKQHKGLKKDYTIRQESGLMSVADNSARSC